MKREEQRKLTRTIRDIYQTVAGINRATQNTPVEINSKQRLLMLGTLYNEFGLTPKESESFRMKRVGDIVYWFLERYPQITAHAEYRQEITRLANQMSCNVGLARFIASLRDQRVAADLALSQLEVETLCRQLSDKYNMRPTHLNNVDVKTVGDLCVAIYKYRDTLKGITPDSGMTQTEAWSVLRLMGRFKLSVELLIGVTNGASNHELCVFDRTTNSARAWVRFTEHDDGSYERAILESLRAWLRLNNKECTL